MFTHKKYKWRKKEWNDIYTQRSVNICVDAKIVIKCIKFFFLFFQLQLINYRWTFQCKFVLAQKVHFYLKLDFK